VLREIFCPVCVAGYWRSRTVVLFGSEARCLTANGETNLRIWERKVLREIFGPVCVAGYWRSRTVVLFGSEAWCLTANGETNCVFGKGRC